MEKEVKSTVKDKKMADPEKASIDLATQEMIRHAQHLGIETIFDRAENMKPCNIGFKAPAAKTAAWAHACHFQRAG